MSSNFFPPPGRPPGGSYDDVNSDGLPRPDGLLPLPGTAEWEALIRHILGSRHANS